MDTKIPSITQKVTPEESQLLCRNLFAYNANVTHCSLEKMDDNINLVIKDADGKILGGLLSDIFLTCLYIDVLWVDERMRGQGYGRALIAEAERLAIQAGCKFVHTSTFSYQSPDFYQALGYQIFAVVDDYPDGIKEFFLKKKLV